MEYTNSSFIFVCRVDHQSGLVLQYIQYVLFAGFGHMAGAVFATILQGKETHRINAKSADGLARK